MDYGNTKITSMRLIVPPKTGNVAAQVAEKLKTVTIRYPSYRGTKRGKKKKAEAFYCQHHFCEPDVKLD